MAIARDRFLKSIARLGVSRFELAERLMASGSGTAFIFITAHDDAGSRERARRLGAKAYLRKPFEASVLMDVVQSLVTQKPN